MASYVVALAIAALVIYVLWHMGQGNWTKLMDDADAVLKWWR